MAQVRESEFKELKKEVEELKKLVDSLLNKQPVKKATKE